MQATAGTLDLVLITLRLNPPASGSPQGWLDPRVKVNGSINGLILQLGLNGQLVNNPDLARP